MICRVPGSRGHAAKTRHRAPRWAATAILLLSTGLSHGLASAEVDPLSWDGDLATLGEFTAPSASGKTALMEAAGDGDLARVLALLENGAKVDERNANGGTALMYAVSANELEIVGVLLRRGADPNANARIGWTPMLVAAAKGRDAAVRLLLAAGAEPAVRDAYGWTPLMRAVSSGYLDAVEALLATGRAELDAQEESGATALHIAAGRGYARIVERLLAAGAESRARDGAGRTPADVARLLGHEAAEAVLRRRS